MPSRRRLYSRPCGVELIDGVLRRQMERNEHVALLIDAHVARAGVPGGGVGEHFKSKWMDWHWNNRVESIEPLGRLGGSISIVPREREEPHDGGGTPAPEPHTRVATRSPRKSEAAVLQMHRVPRTE